MEFCRASWCCCAFFCFLRGINWLAFQNSKFDKILQGDVSTLVKDGVIDVKELEKTKISRQQLFEVLRTKKIFQLGKVKRMYIEACGIFSVYTEERAGPGLPLFPPGDDAILKEMESSEDTPLVCASCGTMKPEVKKEHCPNCGSTEWIKAIL